MDELCFIYPRMTAASSVADELGELHPGCPRARVDARDDRAIVHLPAEVWDQRLVPEIVLGLGGRLTACDDRNDHQRK